MIFSGKENLAAVNYRITVCKPIDMAMENNAFSYKIGVFEIVLPFHIIAYVITNDYFIRITGKIYVSKYIHNPT